MLFIALTIAPSCAFVATAYAATESSHINIQVTHDEYVRIIGSAAGSSRTYSNNDIANWIFPSIVDLGTLGLELNMLGNCDVSMTTLNNFDFFDLLHTTSGNSLTKYKVIYESQEFSETNNPNLSLPCNLTPSIIQFSPTQLVIGNLFPSALIQTGTYSDTVTITVTTQ